MPELPEVENLRLGLQRRILGQRVRSIAVRNPKLVSGRGNLRKASPKKTREFIRGLTGARILDVTRRAKNLVFHFSGGKRLVVHLKMSGQFVYKENGKNKVDGGHPIRISETVLPNPHTRLIFELGKGILYYNDTRMFGYLLYYPSEAHLDKAGHFRNLGLEPLDAAFTPAYFRGSLRARKARLKSVLMDQAVVTGLGNIYADEVCFLAKVRPNRRASSLSDKEIGRRFLGRKLSACGRQPRQLRPGAQGVRPGGGEVLPVRKRFEKDGHQQPHHGFLREVSEVELCPGWGSNPHGLSANRF